MAISDFSPADMNVVMLTNERVFFSLKLTDSAEHMAIKTQISELIMECAEHGERDLQRLIDCAYNGLRGS